MAGVKANKPAGARVVTTEYSSHLIFAIFLLLLRPEEGDTETEVTLQGNELRYTRYTGSTLNRPYLRHTVHINLYIAT